jgi:hypothetical protein
MSETRFLKTVTVGSTLFTLQEDGVDERMRFLSLSGGGAKHKIRLLSCYEPSVVVAGDVVCVWGGTKLYAFNAVAGSICQRDFDTGLVAIFPHERLLLVVTELEVLLVNDSCQLERSLLIHQEVFVDAQFVDGRLRVRDLQGRSVAVDVER